jgi:hypothetical protein
VNVTVPPGPTVSGLAVLVSVRSALGGLIVIVAMSSLFEATGSAVEELTAAVLVSVCPSALTAARATIVTLLDAPAASVPIEQRDDRPGVGAARRAGHVGEAGGEGVRDRHVGGGTGSLAHDRQRERDSSAGSDRAPGAPPS